MMRRIKSKKESGNKDIHFIKLCTLGVAAIFAITVLVTVLVINLG